MRLPSSFGTLPTTLLLTLPLLLPSTIASPYESMTLVNGLKIDITKSVQCDRKTQNGDTIFVHYRGTLLDGTQFDSSYDRGKPFSFTLGTHSVIKGWDVGLLGMCTWEQRTLTIPPDLAYGDMDMGVIPPGSTLVFETELRGIQGVEAGPSPTGEEVVPTATSTSTATATTTESASATGEGSVGIQTAPPEPEKEPEKQPQDESAGFEQFPGQDSSTPPPGPGDNGECKLLGPFSLLVQGALGLLALLSLVYKRWRERPRRPLKIWFFDVSKQVVGAMILHVLNLMMSMLSSGKFDVKATPQYVAPGPDGGEELQQPNGCSFYLLNLAIDTTIGIPILVFFLHILHGLFMRTPLANPPQSITSGNYGQPPKFRWWLKQFLIYVIGLILMKLCVFALFQLFPWLGWVGDWALRWTEGDERLQIAFVMLIFPLIMNAAQYWIIDSFIKDPAGESYAYEQVNQEHETGDENQGLMGGRRSEGDDGEVFVVGDEDVARTMKEVNPTPVPAYQENGATSSRGSSRGYDEDEDKKTS